MIDELIATARRLAQAGSRRPRQADLKRAVSSAYYALFHALARDAADQLVGVSVANRPDRAWAQVYRALEHRFAKEACGRVRAFGFPAGIRSCAVAFVGLQDARHAADYDPTERLSRAAALAAVDQAEQAIRDLRAAPRRDRRAFAVLLLLKRRP